MTYSLARSGPTATYELARSTDIVTPKRSCSAFPRARGWPPYHLPVLALKARRGQLPSWYGRSGDLAKPLASSAREISRARLRTAVAFRAGARNEALKLKLF